MKNIDLTKEIERNGVKFIPIVELAKIAGYIHKKTYWSGKEGASANLTHEFSYSAELGFYMHVIDDFYSSDYFSETEEVIDFNQWVLFQKLIEWEIDFI